MGILFVSQFRLSIFKEQIQIGFNTSCRIDISTDTDPLRMTIEQRLAAKIAAASPYFDMLAAAVVVHNLKTKHVLHMSQLGLELLGTSMQELGELGDQYHSKFFNPDEAENYVPKIFDLLERNDVNEFVTFFQQVRSGEEKGFQWWLTTVRIFMHDDDGAPISIISTSVPVDTEHNLSVKVERLLQENTFLKKHKAEFSSLTKREQEIIKLMAQDISSGDIAEQMHLSEDTVKTHRRNIKKKINAANHYDVVRFVQAFDML